MNLQSRYVTDSETTEHRTCVQFVRACIFSNILHGVFSPYYLGMVYKELFIVWKTPSLVNCIFLLSHLSV